MRRETRSTIDQRRQTEEPRESSSGSGIIAFVCGLLVAGAIIAFVLTAFRNLDIQPPNTAQAQEKTVIVEMTATPEPTIAAPPTSEAQPAPAQRPYSAPPAVYNPPPEQVQLYRPEPTAIPTPDQVCYMTDDVPESNVCGPRSDIDKLRAQSEMIANQVLGGNVVQFVTPVPAVIYQ